MSGKPSAEDVAQWMTAKLDDDDLVYQDVIAYEISQRFGESFTYTNANGNLAINRDVLKAFNTLTAEGVVWERGNRAWRKRQAYDKPGRQQS